MCFVGLFIVNTNPNTSFNNLMDLYYNMLLRTYVYSHRLSIELQCSRQTSKYVPLSCQLSWLVAWSHFCHTSRSTLQNCTPTVQCWRSCVFTQRTAHRRLLHRFDCALHHVVPRPVSPPQQLCHDEEVL